MIVTVIIPEVVSGVTIFHRTPYGDIPSIAADSSNDFGMVLIKLVKTKIVNGSWLTAYTRVNPNILSSKLKLFNRKNSGIHPSTIGIIIAEIYNVNIKLLPLNGILSIAYAVGIARINVNNAPNKVTIKLLNTLVSI